MSREQTKAARYIQLLDHARCSGNWDGVPELVRKIRKHASERACLALTAESEYAMSRSLHGQGSKESNSELSRLIAPLISMRKQSTKYPEDDFQAQICLAWIYWAQADYVSAAEHSLSSTEQDFLLEGSGNGSANWTRICIIKGAYIRGSSLTKTGVPGQALEALEAALPVLASMPSSVQNENELKTWTELLLTQFCILSSHSIRTKRTTVLESDTLSAFRAWSKFWDRQSLGGFHAKAEVSRRYVWKEYYASISIILQEDLPYPTTSLAVAYNDTTTRRRQRAELQHVETCYENLLLKEVSFPRAEQASEEIEEWVNLVVQNWKVLCGSNWQEEELGEGGRETATRNVLDILYRAATKTFHSTSILRHLFTVHLAVADFDLAFKAFDTYIEIVKKSKARVEKTNEDEPGLDDDATVLKTVSEAIRALCRYGSHREVEKARDTAHYFKDWLTKRYPDRPQTANGSEQTFKLSEDKQSAYLPSHIKALIWGAIGIADAQWARVTYEASNRSEIQLEAIKCLGKSLSKEYGRTRDIDSLYALALVFAERRELNSALEVVKSALLPPLSSTSTDVARYGGKFSRERSLIPLWHLLALLLSARQEFNTAVRACEGAFEQFRDPANLFGTKDLGSAYRSEHLNESEADTRQRSRGVVDEMDDSEKETVLEVKMTQLVLVEIMEGPDVAISASEELLSLYSRLFGGQHSISSTKPPPQTSQTMVPRSSAGTLRSIKGSIFGRKSIRTPAAPPSGGQLQTLPERPQTSRTVASTVTRAPTIHVTSTNGNSSEKHHHEKLHKKGSLRKKDSTSRRDGSTSRAPASLAPESINSDSQLTAAQQPLDLNLTRLSQVGLAISPDFTMDHAKSVQPNDTPYQQASYVQSLPLPAQNLPQKEAALQPLGAPGHQDTRLPIGPRINHNPTTKFSKVEQHRQRVGSLVRVWLLIAGFYRRGEMLEDARGAIDEAANLVQGLEDDISNLPPGTASVDEAGWGQKKSVEEMWGDVLSERAMLSVAKDVPHVAMAEYEAALVHFADHPSAIVGLSNILLDVYTEKLPPPPPIAPLQLSGSSISLPSSALSVVSIPTTSTASSTTIPQTTPLGLPTSNKSTSPLPTCESQSSTSRLDPPHRANACSLLDRLAARDRAYGLLNGLTKLGSGWNYSEAWYALARAYEEGGQLEKTREVLWWCVELEEGKGVRSWDCVGTGRYVL